MAGRCPIAGMRDGHLRGETPPTRSPRQVDVLAAFVEKDDCNLHWGHRLLSHHLTEAGVPHLHTENPGNHGGRWPERYQVALKWLSDVLEHEPA